MWWVQERRKKYHDFPHFLGKIHPGLKIPMNPHENPAFFGRFILIFPELIRIQGAAAGSFP